MIKSPKKNREEPQSIDWFLLLLGVALILFGGMVFDGVIMSHRGGVKIDLRPFKIPLAIISAGIGLYSIWTSLTKTRYDGNDMLICPKCSKALRRKETNNNACPIWNVDLEPLEGFYERHPELNDKNVREE